MRRIGALLLGLTLAACAEVEPDSYQGYVEGELVYVAAPLGGELQELAVTRGQEVAAGALLFRLDPEPQALQLEGIEQRMAQARAKLADMEKGSRPSELAAIEARADSARAALERAERDYQRRRELVDAGHTEAVSDEELDRYRTDRDVRRAELAMLSAELDTARLGGRPDAVAAAQREVEALAATLGELRWQLEQKAPEAPAAGVVQDTLYRVGEFVAPGRPVVSLLPPANVKLRFFVPQALLPRVAPGTSVQVHLDGLAQRARATVSYVSPTAEYTPPVIYSKESRTKLVFLVEAVPDPALLDRLRPGQPLEVFLD